MSLGTPADKQSKSQTALHCPGLQLSERICGFNQKSERVNCPGTGARGFAIWETSLTPRQSDC
jgi:hypothetical protein